MCVLWRSVLTVVSRSSGLQVKAVIRAPKIAVEEASCGTKQLARFFPEVRRVAMPAVVERQQAGSMGFRQVVSIEFASADFAIFGSALPLEFEEHIQLENDRGQIVKAKVVAVNYLEGFNGVAVQILNGPFSWMKKP